ncbi:response regulator transcription factor [Paenibacillus antarcticus]|uniref:DNA-binding response regulator n=1 Tax=Paenibacillus antarcticus TaxID=253703 RepID=A0A168QL06_9BACL|nr:response regulator [Paenibacillus antarcticus]OAB47904.1 DNA-binding response regulator [Paenibacillus antarcticus]
MYTLMLVEDEELVRNGIKRFVPLSELNITEIIEASNGEEGLRLFESHRPDVVLLDINMPKMNGLEFARKIKELKPNVKIAVITGYDYYDYAVTALKIGIDDYVLKPVSKNDVFEVLSKLVDKMKREEQQTMLQDVVMEFKTTMNNNYSSDDAGYKVSIAQIVEDNISNPAFSLTILADQMGFSSGYMSVMFKRLFNVSFQDYMVSIRLERAKLQLLISDMKMYEISFAVGFDNPNYFSVAFKKKFGLSPLQYRERIKDS